MPTYRIGIGSEFNLKDRKVGIGSESPIGDLDITGIIKSANLYTSGISTLITYSGFSASNKDRDSITLGYNDRQIYTMSVTNNGTDHYTFSNAADRKGVVTGGDPDITINVGDTLKITNTVGATHPLWINHTQGTGNGNGVSDVIGNGDARNNAVVTWIPTESGVYYYNCQHHANMTGRITVQAVSFDRNYSTELDIVVGVGETFTLLSDTTLNVGSISDVKVGNTFRMPVGDRPEVPVEGTVRFNKDLNTLEFYNGVEWRQFTVSGQSGRGFFAGGVLSSDQLTSIERIQIATTGRGVNYGDMVTKRVAPACCSSSTRGIVLGGSTPGTFYNEIDYFAIASGGQAADFGNLTEQKNNLGALSSSTRGIRAGGGPNTNVMDYIEIATVGNAIDFGDLLTDSFRYSYGASSPTRGLFMGGQSPSTPSTQIQYVTIATKGNAHDFGDLTKAGGKAGGCSNTIRALAHSGPYIEYVTIASQGNAAYFGDLVSDGVSAGCASQTRAIWADGNDDAWKYETVEIASSGNSTSFGDMAVKRGNRFDGKSDSHGGLGGY